MLLRKDLVGKSQESTAVQMFDTQHMSYLDQAGVILCRGALVPSLPNNFQIYKPQT